MILAGMVVVVVVVVVIVVVSLEGDCNIIIIIAAKVQLLREQLLCQVHVLHAR